jgi:3-dehydroquinate dehydratase-1
LAARTLRIGKVSLRRHRPTVIVPITDRTPAAALRRAVAQGLDLAEARVDLFRELRAPRALPVLERARRLVPLLVTVRAASEGGAWRRSEEERIELYRALLPQADAVDIELAAPGRASLVKAAHQARKLVILSQHDFRRTPPDAALDRAITRGFAAGADIVKLAAHLQSDADCARLTALFARHPGLPLVVIGMGDHGKKTRVLFPALGSLFTFAALDRSTAPGQLAWGDMRRELALFFPDYRARIAHTRSR